MVETNHSSPRKCKFKTVWDFKAQHVGKVVETYYLSYIGQCEILRLNRSIKWGKHTTLVGENSNLGHLVPDMSDLLNTPDPSDFVLCLQITIIECVNKGRNWKDREVVHIWYTF